MSKQADFYRQLANPKDRKLFNSLLQSGTNLQDRKVLDSLSQPEAYFYRKHKLFNDLLSHSGTEMESLFNSFKSLSYRIRDCGAIVQNEGQTITEKELAEWSKISASLIVDLADLFTRTKAFIKNNIHQKKDKK